MRAMDPGRTLASEEAAPLGDTSVPWSAKLVQPDRMTEGSRQVIVIDVSGPRLLEGPIWVHVGTQEQGRWEGEPGTHRRMVAFIRPSPGVHRVLVKLLGASREEAPLLEAGKIVVGSQ